MKQEIKKIEVLEEVKFNRPEAKRKIKQLVKQLYSDVEQIETKANELNVYVRVDKGNEYEKRIIEAFPFLRVAYNTPSWFNYRENEESLNKLVNTLEKYFKERFKNALSKIGFISLNENNKTIKVKREYSTFLNLHYLSYIATLPDGDIKKGDFEKVHITILKEYNNGNVEFKFNSEDNYNIFKELVFYSTAATQEVINKADDVTIMKYKEAKRTKHLNERFVIYKWMENNNIEFKERHAINYNLINKAWGC